MKRKICFAIAAAVFLLGVLGVLNRKDPIEKNIGNVYINDGTSEIALKGHKVSVNRNGKKSEYDYPDIKTEADRIYKINSSPESSGSMKLSYSGKCHIESLYSVYDSDFNEISGQQTSLNIPGDSAGLYYVSISVLWGNENENINMIYYFSVQT